MSGWFNQQMADQTEESKKHIKISQQIVESIGKLDKTTTRLNVIMICLTVVLILLTAVLVWLTFKLAFPMPG